MKKLNIDNWFFRTMALIGDWVMLSVLWVIGCLPVVTAGAATLSVFAVAHKMAAVAATLVWVLSFSWGLALLARFTYRKSADALKNGLVLALRTPRAALLTLLLAVLPWAVLTGAPALFFYLLPFWLFVLPGASAWCIARAMRPAVTELEHKNNYYLDREENP